MHKIPKEKVYQISVPTPFAIGYANVYLITGDVLTLIDAGVKTKEAWISLKEQLSDLGYAPEDVEQVVLTHHHPDHTGLIDEFPKLKRIIGHKDCNLWLKKDLTYLHYYRNFLTSLYSKHGVPLAYQDVLATIHKIFIEYGGNGEISHVVDERDKLPGLESWVVYETKGHAQTHLSFLRETDGLCISGDHLLQQVTTTPFLEAPYSKGSEVRRSPFLQYRENLKKCKRLNISKVLPGHGPSFIGVDQLITIYLNNHEKYANKILSNLTREQNPYQLSRMLFPNYDIDKIEITMSMTIGYLDYLEVLGHVSKTMLDGIWYYKKVRV